ncbi:MAG: nuclear transport factor 2 family protein, partial [Gemmatimonadaceae bacterium]
IQLRLARGAGGDIVPFIQVRAHTGTLWLEVDSGNNGPVFLAPHAMAQLALKDSAGGRMTTGLDVVGLGTIAVHAAQRNLVFDGQLNPAFLRQIVLTIDLATGRAWAARAGDERSSESDSLDIIQLEHEWLETRDSVALDSILGDDFLHPVSPGVVIDKRANIAWLLAHPIPADVVERFRSIAVRLYGTAAIANGAVSKLDSTGRETSRFLFTDVFVRRRGRWVAVNAQETAVSVPAPH